MMGIEEKLAVLAKAIIELSEKAARTWDFDGESMVGEGVMLSVEQELREIAAGLKALSKAKEGKE